jgi:hypothetical protein
MTGVVAPTRRDGSSRNAVSVSVVIPAFNAQDYLEECLNSVLAQTGVTLEVAVVDDGSTDRTVEIASRFPGVTCVRTAHHGPAAARNAGIAATTAPLIAFIDADDVWPPDKLSMQADMLRQHPAAAMAFGDCRQFDRHGPRERTEFEANGFGRARWSTALVADAYISLLQENFITTGSVLMRRDALQCVGGFSEDLRLVEDLELWLRIARRFDIAWCPEVCLLRRRHDMNASRDPEAMGEAYLAVLQRQADLPPPGPVAPRALLRRLMAREHRDMARTALRSGRIADARRHAWLAVTSDPGLANAKVLAEALLLPTAAERRGVE